MRVKSFVPLNYAFGIPAESINLQILFSKTPPSISVGVLESEVGVLEKRISRQTAQKHLHILCTFLHVCVKYA